MSQVPIIKKGSISIPILGFGTWKSKPGEVTRAVQDAIDVGYRHFDGAFIYGNEPELGEGFRAKIAEGVIKREDVFVTSKIWNTFHRKDLVIPACKKTLENLGFDYVDLYLIHWPMGYKEDDVLFPRDADEKIIYSETDFMDTWMQLEECLKLGLTKAIGVSNFNHEQIERILKNGTVKPAMIQAECHPYLNQNKLIEFCRANDLLFTGYSPLGSPDRPWAKPDDPKLLEEPKIMTIAKKYNKSPAQVVLRWQIQRDVITIPKSVTKSRIAENFNIFDFELSTEDMKEIDSFNCNGRAVHLTWAKDHKYYPFNAEY